MKKLILLIVILPLFSLAQDARGHQSRATIAMNEGTPEVLLGTITSAATSRELVLLDPRLIAQQEDCGVTSYSFSITSGNKSWGPVTVNGPKLSDDIKDKIIDWDTNNVTITFDNIHLNCGGQQTTSRPVVLRYDH